MLRYWVVSSAKVKQGWERKRKSTVSKPFDIRIWSKREGLDLHGSS